MCVQVREGRGEGDREKEGGRGRWREEEGERAGKRVSYLNMKPCICLICDFHSQLLNFLSKQRRLVRFASKIKQNSIAVLLSTTKGVAIVS